MGDTFLAIKEVHRPHSMPDNQGDPIAATVKNKLYETVPIILYLQQCYGPILLFELIACVNEEKPPVVLLWVIFPKQPRHVNTSLDPGFQPSQICSVPQALLASGQTISKTHLANQNLHV